MKSLLATSTDVQVGSVAIRRTDTPQTQREKLARIVLDSMYQFVGLLDIDGRTLQINRAALECAGVAMDDIRGRPFWEARWFQVSREITEQQREFIRRARGGEFIRCDMEVYGQAAGDETIVVDFSLLPVRDEQGQVVFLLAEGRNITAKKKAEAEIARKNAELETLLERIRQLDQLKSDFFANVSHELRTPLALILGPVESLLDSTTNLSEMQQRQLGVIQRSASSLLKHVNDLLDLARLDAQHMELHRTRLDMAALVRDQAEQFHVVAPQHELSYVIATPQSLPAFLDQDKTERILQNLLSNAFKFTPPGGRIRCILETSGRGRCLLSAVGTGLRPWRAPRDASGHLRTVPPGAIGYHPEFRRHWPGPIDRQGIHRAARRRHRRHRGTRWRIAVPGRAAAGAITGRGACQRFPRDHRILVGATHHDRAGRADRTRTCHHARPSTRERPAHPRRGRQPRHAALHLRRPVHRVPGGRGGRRPVRTGGGDRQPAGPAGH